MTKGKKSRGKRQRIAQTQEESEQASKKAKKKKWQHKFR